MVNQPVIRVIISQVDRFCLQLACILTCFLYLCFTLLDMNSFHTLQQRGFPTAQQTPVASQAASTSGAQSPSRSLFGNIGQRGILPMSQNMKMNQMTRQMPSSSGILR